MSKIRSIVAAQSSVGEPEHRGDERSEAARSGGSPTLEPDVVPVVPDSEVPARHARRRFTTAYKLDILRDVLAPLVTAETPEYQRLRDVIFGQ